MRASDSQGGLVRIGGTLYAAGLVWYDGHTDAPLSTLIREAVADLHKDAQFAVKRPGVGLMSGGQFGLATANLRTRPWIPSLAAAAASGLAGNWLAAIRLDDGRWWVGAAHERAITSDGDGIFSTESEALTRFRELRDIPDATREVYCPRAWDIPEALDEAGDFIARGEAHRALLVPLGGSGALPGMAGIMQIRARLASSLRKRRAPKPAARKEAPNWGRITVLAAFSLATGAWLAKPYIENWINPPPPKARRAEQVLKDVWAAPWLAAPGADKVISHCQQMREDITAHLLLDGWSLADGICRPEGPDKDGRGVTRRSVTLTIAARHDRHASWSDLSSAVAAWRGPDRISLAATSDPMTAALIEKRPLPFRPQTAATLWTREEVIAYLGDLAGLYGWNITFGQETRPANHPNTARGENIHESGAIEVTFTAVGGFLPADFPSAAPGLILTNYLMATNLAKDSLNERITLKAYYRG